MPTEGNFQFSCAGAWLWVSSWQESSDTCIHCAAALTAFLPRPLSRAGLIALSSEASSTQNESTSPLTVSSECSLRGQAALQNSRTVISDWTDTTEQNWLLEISVDS